MPFPTNDTPWASLRFGGATGSRRKRVCVFTGLWLLDATDEQADHINRAVNAHDALVEALARARANEGQDACCLPAVKLGECRCWRCKADAALKLARGDQ